MNKKNITTKEEAREYAIEWQQWVAEQNPIGGHYIEQKLYQSDLVEWQEYFVKLGKKFGLIREFRENGII